MFKKRLSYEDFWRLIHDAAKRYATEPGGPDYRRAIEEMMSNVRRLSDADIILIIEEMNGQRTNPWSTRMIAALISEQSRRAAVRHRTIVWIAGATLVATLVTLGVTYASLQ